MENKSNSAIIIVLLIISVGLGAFIFYDKVLKDETSNEKQADNQSVQNNSFSIFSKNLKENISNLDDSIRMYQSVRSEFV